MYNTDMPSRAELPGAGRLLRSTLVAALVAAVLLVTAVLPAEYGIDPTGVGRMLGLTQMGEIKTQLAQEAAAEAEPPGAAAESGAPAPAVEAAAPEEAPAAAPAAEAEPANVRSDTVSFKLAPNAAAEIKLVMKERARVEYEWSSAGGAVNYDTHGDPFGAPRDFYHGYGKGRNQPSDAGTLEAAFDGKHGWFWRNRSGKEVTITLKVRGDYEKIERVI
ncbi:MAG: transmembrane anchor protein [Zoogloeaceae bacterium]|nr:transmembrane anchor protein [Zoogloeaceae bacterium]